MVNPDGSFRQEPVLLRSSGYDELNRKALEVVRQYEPPTDDAIKAYTVTVGNQRSIMALMIVWSRLKQPSGTRADT